MSFPVHMKTAKAHTITYVVIIPILGQKRNTHNPKKRGFAKKCVFFLSKGIKKRLKQKANENTVRQTEDSSAFISAISVL